MSSLIPTFIGEEIRVFTAVFRNFVSLCRIDGFKRAVFFSHLDFRLIGSEIDLVETMVTKCGFFSFPDQKMIQLSTVSVTAN